MMKVTNVIHWGKDSITAIFSVAGAWLILGLVLGFPSMVFFFRNKLLFFTAMLTFAMVLAFKVSK